MPTSNEAVDFLSKLKPPLELRWLNTDRKSDDWKVKIFQHDPTGLQVAAYDRRGIFVLLQHEIPAMEGTKLLPKRPKSDALKTNGSNFSSIPGAYYAVEPIRSKSLGGRVSRKRARPSGIY